MYGGPLGDLGDRVEFLLVQVLASLQILANPSPWNPLGLTRDQVMLIGYLVIDAPGLILIIAAGRLARRLRQRVERRTASTAPPSS
jgi:hypothetical protein